MVIVFRDMHNEYRASRAETWNVNGVLIHVCSHSERVALSQLQSFYPGNSSN